jgi:ATP phosphoribosyltransferase
VVLNLADTLTIAVSKGRILDEALPLLAHAGIHPADDPKTTRKLLLTTNLKHVTMLVIRAQDVPTFVQYGAADFGIAGKDVLLEHAGDSLYEPLDLRIACCRMVVAGREQSGTDKSRPRVATKYIHTTNRHFARRGVQAEIIHLAGSMELAPITGLADQIVDLVDTGNTLAANGLVEFEKIADISSRLVVNKASMKMKHTAVTEFIGRLRDAVLQHHGPV